MTKTDPKRLAYLREWAKRPEVVARRKAYRERTREARNARNRVYMQTYNLTEKKRTANRQFMQRYNKLPHVHEMNAERLRVYRLVHGEHLRAEDRRRYREDPARYKHHASARRARTKGAMGSHSRNQWLARVAFHLWRCFYCKCPLVPALLTKDHAVPLVKGGTDWPSNLVPACEHCNASKQDRTWYEFLGESPWQ